MASRRKKKDERKLTEKDISGLKYFHQLDSLLSQLHDVGCERDTAGNRTLHMDQYCLLVLLYLFNPIVSSLRAVQQASELKNVQKKLGCARASLGSLSESVSVFDADTLAVVDDVHESNRVPGRYRVAIAAHFGDIRLIDNADLFAL